MGCVCTQKLQSAIASLKNAPLRELAAMVPKDLQAARIHSAALAVMTAQANAKAMATGSATATGTANVKVTGTLSASVTAAAVMRLHAFVDACAAFGVNPLAPGAMPQLARTAATATAHLPTALAAANAALAPFLAPLATIGAMLGASTIVRSTLGVNMMTAGAVAALTPTLTAMAAANAKATATANASANANANASMSASARASMNVAAGASVRASSRFTAAAAQRALLQAHANLLQLGKTLGLDLLSKAHQALLAQALTTAALTPLPPVVGAVTAARLAGSLTQLAGALAAGPALAHLAASSRALAQAGLTAGVSARGSASMTAAMSQTATATTTASLSEAASANFAAMSLATIPNLGKLPMAAAFLNALGGLAGGSPIAKGACSSCTVGAFA